MGYSNNEEEAARAYDLAAAPLGKPVNFPATDSGARAAVKGSFGGSSHSKGVSWTKAARKWEAHVTNNGKLTHWGNFDDEEEAGKSYDVVAARFKAHLNFPAAVSSGAHVPEKRISGSSHFKGVSWHKRSHKWEAFIQKHGKQAHLGNFEDEIEAALACDVAAARFGMPLNFPAADSDAHAAVKGSRGGSSLFIGVSWTERNQKWCASIKVDGKRKHLGYFDDDVEAARAYDTFAADLGRQLNMPTAGSDARVVLNSSRFIGVSLAPFQSKWKWGAEITTDGELTQLGQFDDEEEAACAYDVAAARLGWPVNFPPLDRSVCVSYEPTKRPRNVSSSTAEYPPPDEQRPAQAARTRRSVQH